MLSLHQRRWLTGLCVLLLGLTAARALKQPGNYAIGHWLLNYDYGFIKRGLIGALAQPLFAHKSPTEVRWVISTLSLLTLGALFGSVVTICRTWWQGDASTRLPLVATSVAVV